MRYVEKRPTSRSEQAVLGSIAICGGHIDRPQFAVCLRAGGWTIRRELRSTPTRGGEIDLRRKLRVAFALGRPLLRWVRRQPRALKTTRPGCPGLATQITHVSAVMSGPKRRSELPFATAGCHPSEFGQVPFPTEGSFTAALWESSESASEFHADALSGQVRIRIGR